VLKHLLAKRDLSLCGNRERRSHWASQADFAKCKAVPPYIQARLNPTYPASVGRRYQSAISIGRYVMPGEIANTVSGLRPRLERGEVTRFAVFTARPNFIVFRLLRPLKFVDRRQNPVDPLSSESSSQTTEITSDCTGRHSRFMAESTIFVVFRRRAGVALALQDVPAAVPLGRAR
jgi:hypothetical protein